MGEPIDIDAAHFFDFIGRSGPVVLFLSLHPAHSFNEALPRRLGEEHGGDVPFGRTTLVELFVSASPALPFLQRGLVSCGVQTPVDALPGYYLFHDGRMLAWDSGLPIRDDVASIARGSLLGVLVFAFTHEVTILGKALRIAADEVTAARVTARFRQVFGHQRASGPRPAPPPPSEDELTRAHRTLGVPPTATDQEVEAAWRELRIRYHPDLAASDPVEFARRSRFAAEINHARDVIRAHRGRAAR